MKTKITLLSSALAATLAALAIASSAAAVAVTASATGSGQFEFTSNAGVTALRTFAFAATKAGDGGVTGQAQMYNRALPGRIHLEIDCLNVIGNIAVASGTVTFSTEAGISVGDPAIFGVQDNGEGASASPDRITIFLENSGFVCSDITPANVGLYTYLLNDVQAGNVQIH